MGQNCCVAAKDKPLPNRISDEASTYRNVRQSPSWNFRWDIRTHIEDIMENHTRFSHNDSGNATSEVKSMVDPETDGLSDNESSRKAFQISQLRKSIRSGGSRNTKSIALDQSTVFNSSPEANKSLKSSVFPNASNLKSSITIPSSSPSLKVEDPSSSTASSDPTSSRKSIRSPGFQLHRQISVSRIPPLKSLNEERGSPEPGRLSFVLGNELSAIESHGVSSDGWSFQTFSELLASSQRDQSSSHNENLKIFGSNLQTCGVCSKSLKEKSPWSTQKIVSTNDLPVSAVLVCGHVYHAECLESSTSETDIYDPPCQVCLNNVDHPALKKPGMSRTDSISYRKGPFMGASSSMKSSVSKPFLRRHLSTGSRLESEKTRKKWFWPRHLRE